MAIAVVLLCYVLGSFPTAYLAARVTRGFDIRQRGSGQVGGTNVWHSVSRKLGVVVAVVDVCKGLLGVLVARWTGLDVSGQVACAVAVLIGHNWSMFLRFSGGRGLAPFGGAVLLLAPRELVPFIVFALLGLTLKALPMGVIIGVASLPVAAAVLGEPAALTYGLVLMFLIVLFKRVVPRKRWPARNWPRVLLYRALFDRDVRSREAWIHRSRSNPAGPDNSGTGESR